jgi:LmbE family N-acetylglucosaminyl deacetylase
MNQSKSALAIFAHPDDIEFVCAGTLALLHKKGWEIHLASMTPGDVGSVKLSREEISKVRRVEAAKSAAFLGGTYDCLECNDLLIMYDPQTLLKVTALIRKIQPSLVLTHSPVDYMVDHETTSKLTKTACMACMVPNFETPNYPACNTLPHLYYADPMGAKDSLGKRIEPEIIIDISSVIDLKIKMLHCHESQRSWLAHQQAMDNYADMIKQMGADNGKKIGCDFAEGFRQHLGQSYPQDNLLKIELNNQVH